jgi:hypothetical protein
MNTYNNEIELIIRSKSLKQHTTNYQNTLIEIAPDCPVSVAEIPPEKATKTVANYQYEMLIDHPYEYTSDDVLFKVHAIRKEIPEPEYNIARSEFFSKGQPCFRSSPLTKRYGWGVHADQNGKIAIVAVDSESYQNLIDNASITKTKAMKSKR